MITHLRRHFVLSSNIHVVISQGFREVEDFEADNPSETDSGRPTNRRSAKRYDASRPFLRQVESYKVITAIHVVVSCKFLQALPSTDIPECLPNLEHSRLCQLPTELIFLIRDKLAEDPEALLSIRLVLRNS